MAIIQTIKNFFKKKYNFFSITQVRNLKILNFKPLVILSLIVFFFILFFTISNLINLKNNENRNNLSEVTKSNEFYNFKNYFISKINSPYVEVSYLIKNNDTIEKILKNYNIRDVDIKKFQIN